MLICQCNDRKNINILSGRVKDVEDFNQAFRGFGFCLNQINPGAQEGKYQIIQIEDLKIIRIISSAPVYATGSKPPDKTMFSVLLDSPEGDLVSHKTPLPYQSLFGFDSQREVNLITPMRLDLVTLIIPTLIFHKYLDKLERHDLDHRFFEQNHIQLTIEAYSQLQAYLHQIFHLADTNPGLVQQSHPLIRGDLLPLLVACFSAEVCPRVRVHPFRRAAIIQAAEAYMMTNLDRPVTLQEVCQAIKASKSAVSYGFQDIFGMSPMAYLKIRRLNGVRHALKMSHPAADSVVGIANRYGFWHMGHFSSDYKRMFGESPSQTLQRSPDES